MAAQRILRKFPLSLGLGTDICHVIRIEGILKSSRGARFVRKILNPEERTHPKIQWLLQPQSGPTPSTQNAQSRLKGSSPCSDHLQAGWKLDESSSAPDIQIAAKFIAGRFAAKEAVVKAHPHRALTWHDITIRSQAAVHPGRNGAPLAIVHGENEDLEALISISHDGEYATAVCLGAGPSM
ncbi:hypothetical protein N0V93_004238 [Gnomoniopsis smithogilvyi]|uniref:4'-phosphopantetheinyl transferase domain-containing protein n=1 Tax=Gnomoniopsis smithogilvyi TaxID=1191159 RepID=A0A9W8YTC1_9PEZI|nr:hypothetical protein N0V93_004238 [Gnomoniopsis smithogilvyi]